MSSKGRHCGVGALLLQVPGPLLWLVGQSAASLGIGLDRLLCDVGLIDWSIPFSVQGVPGRRLGGVGLPDLGEDIRVVLVVSNGRIERKANVRGECGFEVVHWSTSRGTPLLTFEYCETGDRKKFTQP